MIADMNFHRLSKQVPPPRKREPWEPPLSYAEVRREFVVVLNQKRKRRDMSLPSTNAVMARTGGSKRDVNRFMRMIRGKLVEQVQPNRSGTTRTVSTRSTTRNSETVVVTSERPNTDGITDKDLDALLEATTKNKKAKRRRDPTR